MANRWFTQFYYTLHKKPVQIDCAFTVAATDTAGYGITGLVGGGVQNVYMHTSATPAATVNPASGYIYVKLQDNYNDYYFGGAQVQAPVTGSAINISDSTVLTVGVPYQIVTLGTSTQANWVAMGLPTGTTAAVGVTFFATATGAGTGTGTVKALGSSGISRIELLGNTALMLKSSGASVAGQANGSYLILKTLGVTAAFSGTALGTHVHDFTVIGGQAASTTNNIANYSGPLLGKEQASNATYLGSASATNGGVVAVTAGTPAGTVALTTAAAAPTDGSIIRLSFVMSNSRIQVQGD